MSHILLSRMRPEVDLKAWLTAVIPNGLWDVDSREKRQRHHCRIGIIRPAPHLLAVDKTQRGQNG